MQAGHQRRAHGRVLTGPDLEIQDPLFPGAGQSQRHHHHGVIAHKHPVEHDPEKGRLAQITLAQFGDLGRRRFNPVAGGSRLAHHALVGPGLAARAHPSPQRGHDRRRVVTRLADHRVARQHVLAFRAIAALFAHPRTHNRFPAPIGIAGAALAAGSPILRSSLRPMAFATQRVNLLFEHLLRFHPQAVAQQAHK